MSLTLEQRTKSTLVSHTEENTKDAESTGVLITSPVPSPPGGPPVFPWTPPVEISWSILAPNLGVFYNKTNTKIIPEALAIHF